MSTGNEPTTTGIGIKELSEKGMEIYHSLIKDKKIDESQLQGKVVAIEVEKPDFFVGTSVEDAYAQAKVKYPNSVFHFVHVGSAEKHLRTGRERYAWPF